MTTNEVFPIKDETAKSAADHLRDYCHQAMVDIGWWHKDGQHLIDVDGTVEKKLLLIHSEVSEATEGHRKDLMDDKLPHRKMIEVELADALIRIFDLSGAMKLDIGGALAEKMIFNRSRWDHKPENRAKEGGKKF